MKKTQKERVLQYIQDMGSITSWEAIKVFGITRLADVVFRLKKVGYSFSTETVTKTNRYGDKVSFAKYSLVGQKILN